MNRRNEPTVLRSRTSAERARSAVRVASLAIAICAGAAHAAGRPSDPARFREMAPVLAAHEMRSLDGARLTLGSLRGEVVVVNFWASWCRPCRRELPALSALHADLTRRGGRVVAVSIDSDIDNARRFVRAHRLSLPVVHDGPQGLARQMDLEAVPFTVVLDRGGRVTYATAGASEEAVAAIGAEARRLLGTPGDATPVAGEDR